MRWESNPLIQKKIHEIHGSSFKRWTFRIRRFLGKTYASNEIAQFVNMFGGDYFDWTKEENKEAIQFLHDLVANKETPVESDRR